MNVKVDPETADWEPFGKSLFDDPEMRSLSRVGVVDVGSNSVRLVIFDGAARSPAYFFNEKVMCGLGTGMSETGRLDPDGRDRALAAIARFQALARRMETPPLTAVATAAVRDASDGPDFCAAVRRETGLEVHVIPGEEEARLSAQGVLLGWPEAKGLVCDIGGSSMELAEVRDGTVGTRVTSQLGPLKLQSQKGGKRGRQVQIKATIEDLHARFGDKRQQLFLVGGSWRAIAKLDMARRDYPLRVLHEYTITPSDLRKTARYIAENDVKTLRAASGVSSNRMDLVPLAMEVLARLVKTFQPTAIAISSYGIREGLLYERMPQQMRDRDPLIEACRFAEAKDARLPGYGRALYRFALPLFAAVSPRQLRMVKAACLLHDVSWRAHPDYRAEACFDYATRANLGGLDHAERVFLGLSLLHRYTNKRDGSRFDRMFSLLGSRQIKQAEILGKAMRFGAMLWLGKDPHCASLNWRAEKKILELHLTEEARPLMGEIAQARFRSLCTTLGARGTTRLA